MRLSSYLAGHRPGVIQAAGMADPIALRPWISNADAVLQIVATPSGMCLSLIPDRSFSRSNRYGVNSEPPTRLAERAWVACLWSGSTGYAIDEWAARQDPRWARGLRPFARLTAGLSWMLGPWRGAVQVGSWPLSTSLRETLRVVDLLGVLDTAIERFPDCPIALRHVFADSPPELLGSPGTKGLSGASYPRGLRP